jgi:GAF domain-containing protein
MVGEPALSWLGVPLIVGEQVLGMMAVQSYTVPCLYDEHDQELLTLIGNQVAIALQNARLFEETQQRMREMQLLHDASLAAASKTRLEESLSAVVKAVSDKFENAHVGIGLVEPEGNMIRGAVATGLDPEAIKNVFLPLGEGIVGWVAQHGEPLLIPDVRLDPRYHDAASDTLSEVCVPLRAGSQVIGVLNVESPEVNAFADDDLRLLTTLASNLAVLVERSQLFDSLEQKVEERTTKLRQSLEEREQLQQEIIQAQKETLQELSTPVIPVTDRIIIMPLIGSIDTMRARDITRALLSGIRQHQAKVAILDITGVPIVDSGIASHLNKTIQAARLKGARAIVTGVSDAVAETIVDLGIDWSGVKTLADLQTGLRVALATMGRRIVE